MLLTIARDFFDGIALYSAYSRDAKQLAQKIETGYVPTHDEIAAFMLDRHPTRPMPAAERAAAAAGGILR